MFEIPTIVNAMGAKVEKSFYTDPYGGIDLASTNVNIISKR